MLPENISFLLMTSNEDYLGLFVFELTPQPPTMMTPELEQTLSTLSSHRTVLGYMLLSRSHPVSMIRHSGVIFEGEQGKRYATVIARIIESVQGGLDEIHAGETDGVSVYPFIVFTSP